jgi:hypothetical protein
MHRRSRFVPAVSFRLLAAVSIPTKRLPPQTLISGVAAAVIKPSHDLTSLGKTKKPEPESHFGDTWLRL